jgi:hypothetical protein
MIFLAGSSSILQGLDTIFIDAFDEVESCTISIITFLLKVVIFRKTDSNCSLLRPETANKEEL